MSLELVELLAEAAEEAGMWCRDVIRFPCKLPRVLRKRPRAELEVLAVSAEHLNRRLIEEVLARYRPVPRLAPVNEVRPPRGGPTVLGRPVTAVIRWMGREGWTTRTARTVLERLDLAVPDGTLHAQLRAGRLELKEVPVLTDAEVEELYELA